MQWQKEERKEGSGYTDNGNWKLKDISDIKKLIYIHIHTNRSEKSVTWQTEKSKEVKVVPNYVFPGASVGTPTKYELLWCSSLYIINSESYSDVAILT
jgi:hypothetical protein